MFAEERKSHIAQMIKNGQSVRVNELAQLFDVSESTIRRDLKELESSGEIVRTHGGAVSNANTNFEPSFSEKQDKHLYEKENIGKAAATLIEDGDTIILDSGTTTQYVAKYITAKNITIITNSVNLANELSNRNDIEVIVTGGMIRNTTKSMVGPVAENTLKHFVVDKAFIGANGVSQKFGITTPNMLEASVKKSMIENSKTTYLLVDSSKINEESFSFIAPVSKIDYIVTDEKISSEDIAMYENFGVKIIRAN
ncbi:DeoR/GlpR family DNA-binding transcription regulator [Alkalithermobacter paradoxus]|uniref:HTH-type transcriptional repressor GlcR n=1 Tax=Alkalithermobacter paradoxus TaxID=29349 RepID=A0A1V4IA48_9FIRM|nr:HTH-type transcriptional repressor GlcR [[Clostridium] thermoalcaliphilum]